MQGEKLRPAGRETIILITSRNIKTQRAIFAPPPAPSLRDAFVDMPLLRR